MTPDSDNPTIAAIRRAKDEAKRNLDAAIRRETAVVFPSGAAHAAPPDITGGRERVLRVPLKHLIEGCHVDRFPFDDEIGNQQLSYLKAAAAELDVIQRESERGQWCDKPIARQAIARAISVLRDLDRAFYREER